MRMGAPEVCHQLSQVLLLEVISVIALLKKSELSIMNFIICIKKSI